MAITKLAKEKLAKKIFADYLKSPEKKQWDKENKSMWSFNKVKKWSDLAPYNKRNFVFIAGWHLKQISKKKRSVNG